MIENFSFEYISMELVKLRQRSMFPGGATREVPLSGESIRGKQERNPE
ncbi:hypothetical protein [Brevibacillus reuszeri]|nr:hypothetical protein [Brevibacillus reuszeri]MED1856690.1 hypothetical protein [Brevibacillus reuszeri]